MGVGDIEIVVIDRMQGLGKIPDFILEHFDVDFRHVFVNPPKLNEVRYVSENVFIDEFGITYRRHGYYFEIVEGLQPLYNAKSPKDVENYSLPAIKDHRVRGMRRIAKGYNEAGYAVVINGATAGIWELAERQVLLHCCGGIRPFTHQAEYYVLAKKYTLLPKHKFL